MASVLRVDSASDLPFVDAEENLPGGAEGCAEGGQREARKASRAEDERPRSRRSSRSPVAGAAAGAAAGAVARPEDVPVIEVRPPLPAPPRTTPSRKVSRDSGLEVSEEARGGGGDSRKDSLAPGSRRNSGAPGSRRNSGVPGSRRSSLAPGSRRNSLAPGSRKSSLSPGSRSPSRRGSRALLDVDYDGGRRLSMSRRGSKAVDLAEVVISELRRPTRRSSRAIALELGEIVSVEVRRQSRASSRNSVIEEVVTKVRRESLVGRGTRPSLLTHLGSAAGSAASATSATSDDDDGGDEKLKDGDDESDGSSEDAATSVRSAPAFLDQGSRIPQYVAAIAVNIGSFCNGLMIGWPSVAIPLLQSTMSPIEGGRLGNDEAAWLAAATMLAAMIAIPPWLILNDRYGRKTAGYLVGLAFALHWIVLGVTRNAACLYTARAIGGVACAGVFIVSPTYVKEISEDAIRGELGIVVTIMFNFGILVAYSVGAAVSYKGVNILGLSFVLLFVLCFWQQPESPVYLLSKGHNIRAARSLQWLRGKGADIMDELTALRRANKRRRQEGDATLLEIISDKASFKGIIITTVLCANQALSGLPVVLSFTVSIFMEAGDAISPNMATIIVGALLLGGSYAASLLVDRSGRKLMVIVSNAGMAVCLASLGLYFYIRHIGIDTNSLHLGWLPVASLSLFVVFVSLGVAPLPFVVMTEIFLPQAQRVASIIGYCIIFFFSFVATKFFTNISAAIGLHFCYWIFSIVCVVSGMFTYLCIPETKGRSLESILDELSGEQQILIQECDEEEKETV